jgi:hypothetical protein
MAFRDYDAAEAALRRMIDIRRRLDLSPDRMLVRGLNRLSTLLVETHRIGEAERVAREALALVQRNDGMEHPSTATALMNLAEVLRGRKA